MLISLVAELGRGQQPPPKRPIFFINPLSLSGPAQHARRNIVERKHRGLPPRRMLTRVASHFPICYGGGFSSSICVLSMTQRCRAEGSGGFSIPSAVEVSQLAGVPRIAGRRLPSLRPCRITTIIRSRT